MMKKGLNWEGAKVRGKAREAARLAVNEIMAECVADARADHPPGPEPSLGFERWHNQTGELLESIKIFSPAGQIRDPYSGTFMGVSGIGGTWGADAPHAIFLELGTSTSGPTVYQREIMGMGDANEIPPPIGPLMYPRAAPENGYLRPAADRHYPDLAQRVKENWAKLAGR